MHMWFWWGIPINNFLFFGFDISTIVTLLATCIGLLALGIGMEWLGLVQAKIRHSELVERQRQLRTICPSENDELLVGNPQAGTSTQAPRLIPKKKNSIVRFFSDLGLWLSQQCIGYVLMLSVMAYNCYLITAVVLGYAIGYFVFGQTAIKIKLKNCQVKRDTFCMSDCGDPDKAVLITPEVGCRGDSPACHVSSPETETTSAAIEIQS